MEAITLIMIILIWIFFPLLAVLFRRLRNGLRKLGGKQPPGIFEHHYLDGKMFYMYRFKTVPSVTYIDNIDISRAFQHIQDTYSTQIADVYQSCYFNHQQSKQEFSKTMFVLTNKMMVELAGDYARIFYPVNRYTETCDLVTVFSTYQLPEKEKEFEINIITLSREGLELKRLDIKPTVLDIGLYYNDDFREVDELIRKRLAQQNDKGIVLLHGLPGTGKTTYLRHLVGSLGKKVLFVSPSVAGNLMNPEFIDLLIDNPNSVLIIEDAEDIILDRKHSRDSSVSNLLNISDGLLSDCLSVQIICTFNSSLSMIDSALMRKGRLIARYEFTQLAVEKARKLSAHFGHNNPIDEPMTIAEIANQHEKKDSGKLREPIGFRVGETLMN